MSEQIPEIVRTVHKIFMEKKLRLSTAESCTGGLISHYITALPGSSAFFDAGVVTYSTASKEKILGLKPETISSFGVVSRETAREMADGMRSATRADYAVSTTGILGPDEIEGKDVGLVYIAVSGSAGTVVKELRLSGRRAEIKKAAAVAALEYLIEATGKES